VPGFEPWNKELAQDIITSGAKIEGATLPILHALQEAFGHVPEEAVPMVAHALNVSRAEVHGVVTFYHDFRDKPAGRHVLKLCRAEACQSVGGNELAERTKARLGIDFGETTPDGKLTLEATYCLGLCACAPAALMDGQVVGRLDDAGITELLAEAR
jgi:formate dehydrogenase subunit gamma